MSIGERPIPSVVSQYPYMNYLASSYIPLGGTFTGGQVAWNVFSSSQNPTEPTFLIIFVQGATWSGNSAVSDKVILQNINKRLWWWFEGNGSFTGIILQPSYNNGVLTGLQVAAGTNSSSPQNAIFLVWADVPANSLDLKIQPQPYLKKKPENVKITIIEEKKIKKSK